MPAAVRPIAQAPRQHTIRRNYSVPIGVGCALILTAILVGPKLFRRHAVAPQVPTMAIDQPLKPPTSNAAAPPSPQKNAVNSSSPILAQEEKTSKAPVPVPASIHPENMSEGGPIGSNLPAGSVVRGAVAHQVAPEVLQAARNSIRGTVRVKVKVNVDRSGNVEDAQVESRGPSKYFAQAALEAAQLWQFKPPKVGGRGVLSIWTIQFEFTRDGTTAVPTQEMP